MGALGATSGVARRRSRWWRRPAACVSNKIGAKAPRQGAHAAARPSNARILRGPVVLGQALEWPFPQLPGVPMNYAARIVSHPVAADADTVYDFAHRIENLPQWAAGLTTQLVLDGGQWFSETPQGRIRIEMAPHNAYR